MASHTLKITGWHRGGFESALRQCCWEMKLGDFDSWPRVSWKSQPLLHDLERQLSDSSKILILKSCYALLLFQTILYLVLQFSQANSFTHSYINTSGNKTHLTFLYLASSALSYYALWAWENQHNKQQNTKSIERLCLFMLFRSSEHFISTVSIISRLPIYQT